MTTEEPNLIPPTELLVIARREVAMRERVYPRQIEAGKMKPAKAEHEIEGMRQICAILERLIKQADL
jgi:hypothetical protein